MSEGIQKPNCSTCDKKHELDSCPMFSSPYYMGIGGYKQFLSDIVERNGCFHHPNARAYLMQDVVKELEQLTSEYENGEDDFRDGIKLGIKKAIALLKGVKE